MQNCRYFLVIADSGLSPAEAQTPAAPRLRFTRARIDDAWKTQRLVP